MKDGAKRATRVLDNEAEALRFRADHKDFQSLSVVQRIGKSVRCEDYCSVAQFCSFFKEYQNARLEAKD